MSKKKFEPYQRILVRISGKWSADFFSHLEDGSYITVGGGAFSEDTCIPYEGNEHLLSTTDDLKPKWKPKPDELVAVRDYEEESWVARKFVRVWSGSFYCLREKGLETNSWRYCEPLREHFNVPEE